MERQIVAYGETDRFASARVACSWRTGLPGSTAPRRFVKARSRPRLRPPPIRGDAHWTTNDLTQGGIGLESQSLSEAEHGRREDGAQTGDAACAAEGRFHRVVSPELRDGCRTLAKPNSPRGDEVSKRYQIPRKHRRSDLGRLADRPVQAARRPAAGRREVKCSRRNFSTATEFETAAFASSE